MRLELMSFHFFQSESSINIDIYDGLKHDWNFQPFLNDSVSFFLFHISIIIMIKDFTYIRIQQGRMGAVAKWLYPLPGS